MVAFDEHGAGQAPGHCQCDEREQQGEFGRLCEPGILHVEAARLGVGEQTFDLPAIFVGIERLAGVSVGGDDQHGAVAQSDGAEAECPGEALLHSGETSPGLHQPMPGAFGCGQPFERAVIAIVEAHEQAVADANGEGDVIFDKEFKPLVADELAIGEQELDRALAEQGHEACQQCLALRHGGAAAMVQHVPQDRNACALCGNAQHEQIDVFGSDLPVGSVQT